VIQQIAHRGGRVIDKIEVYSPTQVVTSAFFGGPFAAVFVLKKNFDALGNKAAAKRTVVFGVLFIVLLFALLPFLPEKFPNVVLPLAYSLTARTIAERYQMSKQAIRDSEQFGLRSVWNVAGISLGFFILSLVVIVSGTFALQELGLIQL
jgi:hypothetical protein